MNGKKRIISKAGKLLAEIQEMKNEIQVGDKKSSKAMMVEMGEEITAEDDLEFDVDDIIVQPADGVLIKNDSEEVRLLFFYVKPGMKDVEHDPVRYKAIAEFRIPCSTFQRIAQDIEETAKQFKNDQRKIEEFIEQQRLPMYG